jgi:2-polyprenyl-3-methyl-5-hydroxy-6-metoxy-1,4-benzoquinol methylase
MVDLANFKYRLEEIPCDFCGSGSFVPFSRKMRHDINLETRICTNCLLVQTNPQPVKESIQDFYTNFYHLFHKRNGVDESYLNRSKKSAGRRFQLLTEFVRADQPIRLLEIGPGAGQFLQIAGEKSKWSGEGIELGKESCDFCQSLGLNVKYIGVEDFQPEGKFDVITSFHVLEHVMSPGLFLAKCAEMMNDGGYLYLEVPNFNRPGYPYSRFLQFPHLFNFTLLTLTNYLDAFGFRPIFIDESVSNLTVISKRTTNPNTVKKDFVRADLTKYLTLLKWKERIYRYSEWIPSFLFFNKIKSLVRSIY